MKYGKWAPGFVLLAAFAFYAWVRYEQYQVDDETSQRVRLIPHDVKSITDKANAEWMMLLQIRATREALERKLAAIQRTQAVERCRAAIEIDRTDAAWVSKMCAGVPTDLARSVWCANLRSQMNPDWLDTPASHKFSKEKGCE